MPAKLLSLLLALSLMLCAGSAQAATHTFSGLFSIDCDETVYTADTVSYLSGSDGFSRWLMMLGAEDYLIDVTMCRVEGWEHMSLTDSDSPMTSWYLEEMAESGFEHLDTIESGGSALCLFRAADDDGEYLMAETVANGWTVSFYAYYDDPEKPADDALKEALKNLLHTYQPAR